MSGLTAFDILVLVILAGGAVRGVTRGFIAEIIALAALIVALFALRLFHTPFSLWLSEAVGTESGAAMLAFVFLVGGIWGAGKALGARLGAATRKSAIGPIDRLLGGGFGLLKGLLVASVIYMIFTLAYDVGFGAAEPRPAWLRESRTYPMMRATGSALSGVIAERIGTREDERARDAATATP
jgi:membrane protein required for colicin V production